VHLDGTGPRAYREVDAWSRGYTLVWAGV